MEERSADPILQRQHVDRGCGATNSKRQMINTQGHTVQHATANPARARRAAGRSSEIREIKLPEW